MRALGDLLDPTSEITEQNAHLIAAIAINDFDWIAGAGYDRAKPDGARHGYVLVPKHNDGDTMTEIWAIRIRLQLADRKRDLALFNLGIDSKPRAS